MHELRKGPQGMEPSEVHHVQCSAPNACSPYGDGENPAGEVQTSWVTRGETESCSTAGPPGEGKALGPQEGRHCRGTATTELAGPAGGRTRGCDGGVEGWGGAERGMQRCR